MLKGTGSWPGVHLRSAACTLSTASRAMHNERHTGSHCPQTKHTASPGTPKAPPTCSPMTSASRRWVSVAAAFSRGFRAVTKRRASAWPNHRWVEMPVTSSCISVSTPARGQERENIVGEGKMRTSVQSREMLRKLRLGFTGSRREGPCLQAMGFKARTFLRLPRAPRLPFTHLPSLHPPPNSSPTSQLFTHLPTLHPPPNPPPPAQYHLPASFRRRTDRSASTSCARSASGLAETATAQARPNRAAAAGEWVLGGQRCPFPFLATSAGPGAALCFRFKAHRCPRPPVQPLPSPAHSHASHLRRKRGWRSPSSAAMCCSSQLVTWPSSSGR